MVCKGKPPAGLTGEGQTFPKIRLVFQITGVRKELEEALQTRSV